jgi:hypothetical protein
MKRKSLFAALLAILLAGTAAANVGARSEGGPALQPPSFLRHLSPGGPPFAGVVEEEVPAGGYVYRRIRADDGDLAWVVDLGVPGRVGERVKVRPFGLAHDFRSARTGRVFDSLLFAIVRSQETP